MLSTYPAVDAKPKRGPGRRRKTPVAVDSADPPKRGPRRPRKTPVAVDAADPPKCGPGRARKTPAVSSPPRPRNDLVCFRKRSKIAAALRIDDVTIFRVKHGPTIHGERYAMIRFGNSNAAIPIPEGQLVAVDQGEKLPAELRTCVAELGRYKGMLRPQVRHFLRELQRRACSCSGSLSRRSASLRSGRGSSDRSWY